MAQCVAKAIKKVIENKTFMFKENAKEGHLYGSITAQDIIDLLKKKYQISLSKKNFKLENPIKEVGDYDIELVLHDEVKFNIKIVISVTEEK